MNNLLHLIWVQSNNYIKNRKLIPVGIKKNYMKFIKNNNINNVICWSEEDILNLIQQSYDIIILNTYKNIKEHRFKSDLARLLILYVYGGFYLDVDEESLQSINNYINDETVLSIIFNSSETELSNAFLYVKKKKNLYIQNCLQQYIYLVKKENKGACKTMKDTFDLFYRNYEVGITNNIVIFKEKPIKKLENCKNKQEFWKSFKVFDKDDNILFNSRYSDYYEDRCARNILVNFDKNI